jgi:Tol biopolymer transport system component
VWSADGKQILFSSNRAGRYDIYQQAADGVGNAAVVIQSNDQAKYLNDLTTDGRYAIFDKGGASNGTALWTLPLFGDRKPSAFIDRAGFRAVSAQFSPNGRFVAYASNETGRYEIYVQTFPQQTGKWQISASGGTDPMWRRDGKELFFLSLDEKLMAVDVNTNAGTFQAGIPKELFQAQSIPPWYWRNIYVPSADGQRFMMVAPAIDAKPAPITVVVNWTAMMKK